MIECIELAARGPGLHEFTDAVSRVVEKAHVDEGLCTLFVRHTSASLLIQENADISAKQDLERWLARLVPEDDPIYTHTLEGPDDMPAHVKAALTATWQGIYLWEHRRAGGPRQVLVHLTP
jgi:secondary thiamine-phosphate synthase enzyme